MSLDEENEIYDSFVSGAKFGMIITVLVLAVGVFFG